MDTIPKLEITYTGDCIERHFSTLLAYINSKIANICNEKFEACDIKCNEYIVWIKFSHVYVQECGDDIPSVHTTIIALSNYGNVFKVEDKFMGASLRGAEFDYSENIDTISHRNKLFRIVPFQNLNNFNMSSFDGFNAIDVIKHTINYSQYNYCQHVSTDTQYTVTTFVQYFIQQLNDFYTKNQRPVEFGSSITAKDNIIKIIFRFNKRLCIDYAQSAETFQCAMVHDITQFLHYKYIKKNNEILADLKKNDTKQGIDYKEMYDQLRIKYNTLVKKSNERLEEIKQLKEENEKLTDNNSILTKRLSMYQEGCSLISHDTIVSLLKCVGGKDGVIKIPLEYGIGIHEEGYAPESMLQEIVEADVMCNEVNLCVSGRWCQMKLTSEQIQHIKILHMMITNITTDNIDALRNLKAICLYDDDCTQVTQQQYELCATLTNVKYARGIKIPKHIQPTWNNCLYFNDFFGGNKKRHLECMPNLLIVKIRPFSNIDDEALCKLNNLRYLTIHRYNKDVDVDDYVDYVDKITNESVSALSNIELLELGGATQITFDCINSLPKLKCIRIDGRDNGTLLTLEQKDILHQKGIIVYDDTINDDYYNSVYCIDDEIYVFNIIRREVADTEIENRVVFNPI